MSSSPVIVRILIARGARLVARLADGRTALHLAAARGNVEIVKMILDKSEQNEEEEAAKEDARKQARMAEREGKDEDPPSAAKPTAAKEEEEEEEEEEMKVLTLPLPALSSRSRRSRRRLKISARRTVKTNRMFMTVSDITSSIDYFGAFH
jgi:ankyrin repeat protein